MATIHEALKRFEDSRYDGVITDPDPRTSKDRHLQRIRTERVRGNRLALFAVAGTIGAVTLVPTAVKGLLALTDSERFACDPSTPQLLYKGPNAYSVATQISPSDWQNVPLRQGPDSEPVAAANMAYTFTGSAYGPKDCN